MTNHDNLSNQHNDLNHPDLSQPKHSSQSSSSSSSSSFRQGRRKLSAILDQVVQFQSYFDKIEQHHLDQIASLEKKQAKKSRTSKLEPAKEDKIVEPIVVQSCADPLDCLANLCNRRRSSSERMRPSVEMSGAGGSIESLLSDQVNHLTQQQINAYINQIYWSIIDQGQLDGKEDGASSAQSSAKSSYSSRSKAFNFDFVSTKSIEENVVPNVESEQIEDQMDIEIHDDPHQDIPDNHRDSGSSPLTFSESFEMISSDDPDVSAESESVQKDSSNPNDSQCRIDEEISSLMEELDSLQTESVPKLPETLPPEHEDGHELPLPAPPKIEFLSVKLRPTSHSAQPPTPVKSASLDHDSDEELLEASTFSFSNRRNLWERRSLDRKGANCAKKAWLDRSRSLRGPPGASPGRPRFNALERSIKEWI